MTTPAEQAVLAQIAAAAQSGEDIFGDDEELVRKLPADSAAAETGTTDETAIEDQAASAEDAAATTEQQADQSQSSAATEALDAEALGELVDPLEVRAAQPQRFEAAPPQGFKEDRARLLGERAKAMKQLMDGEMDAEQFAAEDIRISDELDVLTREQVRAETLLEVNRQNESSYQQQVIKSLINRTKSQVDYAKDQAAARQFDTALGLVMAEPESRGKDYAELAEEAHRLVAARRGVALQSNAVTQQSASAPPDRRPKEAAPVTLRNIPTAAVSNTGGNVTDQLARLSGPEYEAAFAKLTPAQQAAMLDD